MAGSSSGNTSSGRIRSQLSPMDHVTDDILIEFFSRVPYRSLRRLACVSRRWRDLIAEPRNHKKLPQTLAGFFYRDVGRRLPYVSNTGLQSVDPCLSFLPDRERKDLRLVDGCNGLLLCRCYRFVDKDEFDYLVINLATEKWVAVPVSRRWSTKSSKLQMARLGFEPAVSSHFHVFEFHLHWDWKRDSEDDENSDGEDDDEEEDGNGRVLGVGIYSSETGLWRYKPSNWSVGTKPNLNLNSVFVGGMLYWVGTSAFGAAVIAAVDVQGRTWRIINFPRMEGLPFFDTELGFIDMSQGKLHLANSDDTTRDNLLIWVLEDVNSEKWTLKHTVSFMHMVRKYQVQLGFDEFFVVAIHPDRNMVFFVFGCGKKLMYYDMDSNQVHMISHLGKNCYGHFIPYVPLFSKSLADGQQ